MTYCRSSNWKTALSWLLPLKKAAATAVMVTITQTSQSFCKLLVNNVLND